MIEAIENAGFEITGQAPQERGTVALLSLTAAGWTMFEASPERSDGKNDPLDRWSARVAGDLARGLGVTVLFPFGGPPHAPFLRWARESGRAFPSPVGMLVHDRHGLWISYRAALVLPRALPEPPAGPRPCDACPAPCLKACPVEALGADRYDIAACTEHVDAPQGASCLTGGCAVRHACPLGHAPPPARARFHMTHFLDAHRQGKA